MYDEDVVERASSLMGGTTYTHKIIRAGEEKTVHTAMVAGKKKTLELLERLLPYMGKRRSARIAQLIENIVEE